MAFMERGDFPFEENDYNGDCDDTGRLDYYHCGHYYRTYYYVPLDNTYVIMQMIVTFIILIVGLISYLFTYKSTIIDPIENMKKVFINIHLILIGILLAITLINNFFSKNEKALLKRLIIISIISLIIMSVFLGIKLNLDKTYNEQRFEQFYIEQNKNEVSNKKSKIDIGITGMSIKTEKEYYIDESIKLYNIFKIKTYGILGIHILLNILVIYQISRISKIQGKKDRINKDDLILFDEEENIKN